MSFCWGWICILYSHWLFLEKFDPSRISLVKNTLTHGGSSSTRVGESRRKMCRSTFTSPSSWLTCLSRKKFRGDKIFLLGWDEGFGHIVVNQFNEQLEFETMILYDLCDLFELVWWSPVADTDTDTNIPHLFGSLSNYWVIATRNILFKHTSIIVSNTQYWSAPALRIILELTALDTCCYW